MIIEPDKSGTQSVASKHSTLCLNEFFSDKGEKSEILLSY